MTFRQDLILGEKYQGFFLQLIHWEKAETAKGCFKEWDIKIWNDKTKEDDFITFEVKCDRKTKYTCNIAIEFECSGKGSGITTTTADFWVYFPVDVPFYYFIPTDVIRKMIEEKKYHNTVRGGDNYNSRMYLFRQYDFDEYKEHIPTGINP